MRSFAGSLLQIPRYFILAMYMIAMGLLFLITALLSLPCWLVGQIRH